MTKKHLSILLIAGVAIIVLAILVMIFIRRPLVRVTSSGQSAAMPAANMAYDGDSMEESAYGIGASPKVLAGEDRAIIIDPPPYPPTSASDDTTIGRERLIIKNGELSLLVNDVPTAVDQIERYANEAKGFVVSSNIYKNGKAPRAEVTIRIPSNIFDSGIEQIGNIGEVQSKQVHGQDVTEEFVDLEARLNNLRRTEAQFQEILERATNISDVLAVQRELSNVRAQIESIQGRMNYLEKSAALSTLTIYLSTDPENLPVVDEDDWKPIAIMKDAIRSLRDVAIGIANAAIWFVVYIPLWIICGLIIWGVYKRLIKNRS